MAGRRYEENYMFLLMSSILSQKELPTALRNPDWRMLYQLSDFQNIAPLIYYGILGQEGVNKEVGSLFFEKYQETVKYQERYKAEERQVIQQFERMRIPCVILSKGSFSAGYPQPEMAGIRNMELLVEDEDFLDASILLRLMDYDEKTKAYQRIYLKYFHKPAGIDIILYKKLPFYSRRMRRYYSIKFKHMLNRASYMENCTVRLDVNDTYAYMISSMINQYAASDMTLRSMVDLWIMRNQIRKGVNWNYIERILKKVGVLSFSQRLFELSDMLFSGKLNFADEEIYRAMEAYIISKGLEGRTVSEQLLPLTRVVADCYRRDRRREEIKEALRWLFPPKEYMETMFPILENHASFLPFCWGLRMIRKKMQELERWLKEAIGRPKDQV